MYTQIRERLWYIGFLVFVTITHPIHQPFILGKRIWLRLCPSKSLSEVAPAPPKEVPKIIWTFWAQGWEAAPPLVQLCRDSWLVHNPTWEVRCLTQDDLETYVHFDYSIVGKNISFTNYSNLLRVSILKEYGGVWADTTTLCTKPLDSWLSAVMQSGFFAYSKPKTTVADWFMAVSPKQYLMQLWHQAEFRYWKYVTHEGRYFWPHYLFEYIIFLDTKARNVWNETPKIDAGGPYAVQKFFKTKTNDTATLIAQIQISDSPVHKLDWRMDLDQEAVTVIRAALHVTSNSRSAKEED